MRKIAAMRPVRKVAICGFGLIGGSLALDLRRRSGRVEIVAYDRPAALASRAGRRRANVCGERNFAKAVADANLIILSAPLAVNERLLTRLSGMTSLSDCLIIDTGAVKGPIANLARTLAFPRGVQFLPTHPMAGREKAGAANAVSGLFRNRTWFIDETVKLSRANSARWEWLMTTTGANPVMIEASLHDDLMAELSHLPQILATVLGAQMNEKVLELAGPGLWSMLRLAGSPYAVWAEIIDRNRDNVLRALEQYRDNLQRVIDLVQRRDSLKEIFAAAARSYRCLS